MYQAMKIKNGNTYTEKHMALRLAAYITQAHHYKSTKGEHIKGRNRSLIKSALVALTPLAAQTIAIPFAAAQCSVGVVNANYTQNTANCDRKIVVDLDGDGVYDMAFEFIQTAGNSFVLATGLNPGIALSVATAGTISPGFPFDIANNVPSGAIASGYSFKSFDGTNAFLLSINGTLGDFATPLGTSSENYLALQNGSQYGFLTIVIDHSTANDRCLSIGNFGLEPTTNTQTVVVGDCSTLPVELLYFSAKAEENNIQLVWETLSEFQNFGFEVERSLNAKDFRKIAWIKGNGTTSDANQYRFKDEKVIANETYYYRLKQVDEDGSFEYSSTVSASIKNKHALQIGTIHPNPASDVLYLPIESNSTTEAMVQLFDKTGRIVANFQEEINKGSNQITLPVRGIQQGIYFARIDVGKERTYRKISILR